MKLITKMLLLIALLLVPVLVLFVYSNQRSVSVVEEQINLANEDRLGHFMESVEATLGQMAMYANIITKDPEFAAFADRTAPGSRYEYAARLEALERKLALFTLSSERPSRISLYFPSSRQAVSSNGTIRFEDLDLNRPLPTNWTFREYRVEGTRKRAFTRYFVEPYAGLADPSRASMIVEVDLLEANFIALLASFKSRGINDPFLVQSDSRIIQNGTSNVAAISHLMSIYDFEGGPRHTRDAFEFKGKQYLAYFLHSPDLGWTLVDYIPLEDILLPVTRSQAWFYATVALLLCIGAVAAYLLYFQVQVPIQVITDSVGKLRRGHYSIRIPKRPNREFQALFQQFNDMAETIEHLIETVYKEELRLKEAVMKQLQSQINPHFLYNSLAFIVSMAKLNRTEPVVALAYRLADYYKYTTRNESLSTTVREELDFVRSYVEIMNYQLDKIQFDVDVPESMLALTVPRLLVQPVVENAILYGIESRTDGGIVSIVGEAGAERYALTVEDNGEGMSDEAIAAMNERLAADGAGVPSRGLRNVHLRLRHQFGEEAGVAVGRSRWGGLLVTLSWPNTEYMNDHERRGSDTQ